MYRRGQADAEADTLNTFYYRHYFPYRRGYDEVRRRLFRPGVALPGYQRMWVWALGVVILALAAWVGWQRVAVPAAPVATPTAIAAVPTATRLPTRTPVFPTNTPLPTPTIAPTPMLTIGKNATVTTAGLRGRREPTTDSQVVVRFREGEQVTVLDGPREADGYTWWQIKGALGTGWSAERSLEGDVWLQLEQ
jgi:hypothetical protein